ncbi:ParB/RepB/Spo0J family partition protein [Anaerococcus hydrogenalis]|uniref:Chromosome partitioning protein ParB n=1 Tax=Anaerococcus hydrogenalis TaxID=33029 RepID=A0A2N6UHB7_9FIRM|nr:ParB/RepB/Spo0J family partition protein [Anaerococcus hydrogenalis]MDK7695535.1 ParB/RepB/Spo0J family partition protein [Anaerococcus hydrogenalis]MDK7697235.1 ParB/RepB/Spo0J family partition protein [Anaerococcus hydrogenalis]MDK7708562.1 ParB/RepB/Spo0J family partition protein [Anaerococcus hydrogenalis]PMC81004.1 chromosome partitioning protein ParB [Anaerococcus hydrogenalis]
MTKKSLGRGLGSLIPENNKRNKTIVRIPMEKIYTRKDQPRKNFDDKALLGLSQSIEKYGLLNPIVLRKNGIKYEIIAGERRYRASKLLGHKEIDAIIKNVDNKNIDILSIVENVQREDLTGLEEANAYNELCQNYNMTQEEVAKTVGKSRSYIANSLRLLKLDENSKRELQEGNISSSQARTLLSIKDEDDRKKSLDDFKNKKTNIRKVEKKSRKIKSIKDDQNLDQILFEDFEEKFIDLLNSKVEIKKNKEGYRVSIDCFSIDDIENLYWSIKNGKK